MYQWWRWWWWETGVGEGAGTPTPPPPDVPLKNKRKRKSVLLSFTVQRNGKNTTPGNAPHNSYQSFVKCVFLRFRVQKKGQTATRVIRLFPENPQNYNERIVNCVSEVHGIRVQPGPTTTRHIKLPQEMPETTRDWSNVCFPGSW